MNELLLIVGLIFCVLPRTSTAAIIDLTHEITNRKSVFPDVTSLISRQFLFKGQTVEGLYFEAYNYCLSDHGGTHLEAPRMRQPGTSGLDEIPLTTLVSECSYKIDVRLQCRMESDYQLSVYDLQLWEKIHGRMRKKCAVLVDTGWAAKYFDAKSYVGLNANNTGRFPGIAAETARWLASRRKILILGIDTAAIGGSRDIINGRKVENLLASYNIPVLKNLADMTEVPAQGFQLNSLPLKFGSQSTGSPARVIAITSSAHAAMFTTCILFISRGIDLVGD